MTLQSGLYPLTRKRAMDIGLGKHGKLTEKNNRRAFCGRKDLYHSRQ